MRHGLQNRERVRTSQESTRHETRDDGDVNGLRIVEEFARVFDDVLGKLRAETSRPRERTHS